jgi:hypothetical protein
MIPVNACEPFFEYMRKSIELDSGTMQLIAAQTSMTTFPPKHIILPQAAFVTRFFLLFQARQDLTI